MKIRTRAFIGLGLIYLLAGISIGLIAYTYTASTRLDAEQQRISEVLNLHGTVWRSLVEARANHLANVLTGAESLRDRRDDSRRLYATSMAQLTSNARDQEQLERLARIRSVAAAWFDRWEEVTPIDGGSDTSREQVIRKGSDEFLEINRQLVEFDTRQRDLLSRSSQRITELRGTMAFGRVGFAGLFIALMTIMVWFAKRGDRKSVV